MRAVWHKVSELGPRDGLSAAGRLIRAIRLDLPAVHRLVQSAPPTVPVTVQVDEHGFSET